jgi:hypothetical protein
MFNDISSSKIEPHVKRVVIPERYGTKGDDFMFGMDISSMECSEFYSVKP